MGELTRYLDTSYLVDTLAILVGLVNRLVLPTNSLCTFQLLYNFFSYKYSRLLRDDLPARRGRPPPGEPAADPARLPLPRRLRLPLRPGPGVEAAAAAHEDHQVGRAADCMLYYEEGVGGEGE